MTGSTRSTACFRRRYRRVVATALTTALARRTGGKRMAQRNLGNGSDYHFDVTDPFTPTPALAPPLKDNLPNPAIWGTTPLDYVNWFNHIWHTGDPSQWGPSVFTDGAVMIDSAGTSTGAEKAASDFLLLFKYFPDLRGEVISWANNDTEILINWRFVVSNGLTVPVVDKFCFVDGLVSFRLAYFDSTTLLAYLCENYGSGPMTDYFLDRFARQTTGKGGLLYAPKLILALIQGAFLWTPVPFYPPAGLTATSAPEGGVLLRWNAVAGAKSYKVKRGPTPQGPFGWIAPKVETTSYVDRTAQSGTRYYYVVATNPV